MLRLKLIFLLTFLFISTAGYGAGNENAVSSGTPQASSVLREPKISSSTIKKTKKTISKKTSKKGSSKKAEEIKVTFVELGSVKCIPCKMMQPIMKEIEKEYSGQVKVVFYDVWTEEGRPYAEKYAIRAIPTQVFLDKDGKEYYRHTGFFPKEELLKILKMQGVK